MVYARVAQWIRRWSTKPKIPGSIPGAGLDKEYGPAFSTSSCGASFLVTGDATWMNTLHLHSFNILQGGNELSQFCLGLSCRRAAKSCKGAHLRTVPYVLCQIHHQQH